MLDYLTKMCIETEERQQALLEILNKKNQFSYDTIKEAVESLKNFPDGLSELKIIIDIVKSHRECFGQAKTKDISEFLNISYLRTEDKIDLIAYLAQNLFHRKKGQELGELPLEEALVNQAQKDEMSGYFKKFNIIEEVSFKNKDFDYIFIFGAGRPTIINRLEFLKQTISKHNLQPDNKKIFILTGDRELSLTVDIKVDKDEKEVQSYFVDLAKENNIPVNAEHNFTEQKSGNSTKTVLNYTGDERLNEVMMIKKEFKRIFSDREDILEKASYMCAGKQLDGSRPNTKTTVQKAFQTLKDKDCNKELKILAVSNQPHLLRQELMLFSVFKEMKLSNEGFSLDVCTIGSELENEREVLKLESAFSSLIFEYRNYFYCKHEVEKIREDKDISFACRSQKQAFSR